MQEGIKQATNRAVILGEQLILLVILAATLVAVVQEISGMIDAGKVTLADLFMLFIFAEVLGMLGAFYAKQSNLIMLPLFIAMTALSRLIVLQSKETDLVVLLYESGAILLIAAACWVISRMRTDE